MQHNFDFKSKLYLPLNNKQTLFYKKYKINEINF